MLSRVSTQAGSPSMQNSIMRQFDGGAGMVIMETIFSSSPEPGHVSPPPPKKKETPPNLFELISTSYASFFRQQQPFFASWPDISKAIANVSRRMNEDVETRPELQTLAPRTILSTVIWNQRSLNDALWRSAPVRCGNISRNGLGGQRGHPGSGSDRPHDARI